MPLQCYKFGDFELDCARFELRRNGHPLKLERRPLELLILLAEKGGNVVTRPEISEKLWGNDVFVDTEHGINTAVRKVRSALQEDADQPHFVQTVPGKGYRFVAELKDSGSNSAEPATLRKVAEINPSQSVQIREGNSRRRGIAALVLVLLAGSVLIPAVRSRIFGTNHLAPIRSIAVLPLTNLSGDPTQDYFADGMTDELITALAKDPSLRVVSRTSAMQYRGTVRPLPEIARELGVDGIVEGSIVRSPTRVHMTLQLIRGSTDAQVWAESYDRELSAAFSLSEEMAHDIFQEIQSVPRSPLPPRYINPEAHDAFLRGRYEWFSYHNVESAKYFRRAIEIQPEYAEAWSGLAEAYGGAAVVGKLKPQEAWPEAEAAAARALELNDRLADAHNANAGNFLFYRWDFARAEQESARAIELEPNFAEAYHLRSYVLNALNRTDEALKAQKRATELDPFARQWALGEELWRLRRFDEAAEEARGRIAARPNDSTAHHLLSNVYRVNGKYKESVEELEQSLTWEGDQARASAVRQAFKKGGFKAVQEMELANLEKKAGKQYVPPISFAYVYARLGKKEETIHYLQLAYEEHSPRLIHLQYEPDFDFLHSDERYRQIVREVGLPPAF